MVFVTHSLTTRDSEGCGAGLAISNIIGGLQGMMQDAIFHFHIRSILPT
jgi:hypothetical protein